ncbi:uncharacterized protein [Drosophila pseudoobscura]|uniref:Uncharacterized protein isoform X1 n=2 Tax=Drosophila pseudoobscura pseudoobscura TaxID=46245 RepID=A0A6I8UE06_DROPS|nr:uncharacterized protein LOC4813547 isoform X1 [Drosophila pseudoobscura]
MTQLMASSCLYSRQKKVENTRPGTVFMFVNKSGNVVEAKKYDGYNFKDASNPSVRKNGTQSSKSYTASVQQRALQIMKANFPHNGGSQKVSPQKSSPNEGGFLRMPSGKSSRPKTIGDKKGPLTSSGLRKGSQKTTCQELTDKKASTKPLSGADEKALVKTKPKRTTIKSNPSKKRPAKLAVDSINTDGVWFECNVPFRVKIPFPICTQNLFGNSLPAVPSMNNNTICKCGSIVEAEQGRKGGSPPALPPMCITVIPGINQNTPIDQSTSSHLADLKETSGKARTSTERRFKGAKRCSVCETCTQTGYSMEQEPLSNPLLSCLEQIRQHLRAEAENAPKKQTTMQKCECRCFAEKSTSVRSVDGKTVKGNAAPSAAAALKNKRRKTPLKTQKMRLKSSKKDESNDMAFEEYMTQDQPGCKPGCQTGCQPGCQPGCQSGCQTGCHHWPTNMSCRRMRACNACPFVQSPMFGHSQREPPACCKLKAGESKRSASDIATSGFSGSGNVLTRCDSERDDSLLSTVPNSLPGDCSVECCASNTTSDDNRNSDRNNDSFCCACRPEGGVSASLSRRNDRHPGDRSQKSHVSYVDKRMSDDSKSEQTDEELDCDRGSVPVKGLERDERPRMKMKPKENRKSRNIKSRSKSAPANIRCRYGTVRPFDGKFFVAKKLIIKKNEIIDCGSTPTTTDQSECELCLGNGHRLERNVVDRQVSGGSEDPEKKVCSNQQQQQPLVLVPFRLETKNSGKTLVKCQAKEWQNLTLTNVTEAMPRKLPVAPESSSRAPRGTRPAARAAPRRASPCPPTLGCRGRSAQQECRPYPSSRVRCPRHPNGQPLSHRNVMRNADVRSRCTRPAAPQPPPRNASPARRNHQQATLSTFMVYGIRPECRGRRQLSPSENRSNNLSPSAVPQNGLNASIANSCECDSTANNLQHEAEASPKTTTPPGSEQTLTEPSQYSCCLVACKQQCNKCSAETVTLMQPRPLRSNGSLQSDGCADQEASARDEYNLIDETPSCSDEDNQLQSGYGPPSCHFRCQQYAAVAPMRCNQSSSMGSFVGNQSEFMMGMEFQSQSHPYTCSQQSCDCSVCSNATGLIDPRDILPTMSAHSPALVQMSFEPNQMPVGTYQPQMQQSYQAQMQQCYQPEQSFHQVECHPNQMYGSQYPFYRPEDLKESVRSMPVGFYEQTINKYKIDPLDSNFRPPSLGSSFFQQLQHQMQSNACLLRNQCQQQYQCAPICGHSNQHCVHHQQQQHRSQVQMQASVCHCPYYMIQNPFPQPQPQQQQAQPQQQKPRKNTQFKDFDRTDI